MEFDADGAVRQLRLLTSLPTVDETLLRFLNRFSCKTFFDTPVRN